MIARIYMTLAAIANSLTLIKMDILVNEKLDLERAAQFGLTVLLVNSIIAAVCTVASWFEDYICGDRTSRW